MLHVFVDGRAGTTGLQIVSRLKMRADVTLLELPEKWRKDTTARQEMMTKADVTFLCLPDDAAREAVALAAQAGSTTKIIDTSTAHRTRQDWAYGFAELSAAHKNAIVSGQKTAVPGCHAGGFVSLIYPLIAAGVLHKDAMLSCHSITGYTGGGKKMIAAYQAPDRLANDLQTAPGQYGLTQHHKHLPEMTQIPGLTYAPAFCPIVADFPRGMLVTVPLFVPQLQGIDNAGQLIALYQAHYAHCPMIRVADLPVESTVYAGALAGQDGLQIYVSGNDERLLVMALFDNLGHGASGKAVQCMNLMTGCEETEGLHLFD